MSVNDGSPVNAANTNAAYMSRKVDTDTIGKVDLKNASSADVLDVQQTINTAKADIVTNAGNIATNTADIATNAGNIATNTANIATNTGDIATINTTLTNKADLVAGKVPVSQLPTDIMQYKGNWDANTNTPTLDGTGDAGDVYLVNVAGSQDLGSGSITFAIGDWAVYNGTIWEKSVNSAAVTSVNSQTGAVVLDADDIAETATRFWDIKNNFSAIVDPTVNEDSGDGYEIGSQWFNKSNETLYVLQDATLGAANWVVASGSGGGGLDTYYTQDFEKFDHTDLAETGNGTFESGGAIVGAMSTETTSPISKTQSIKYTAGATSANDYFVIESITLSNKQKAELSKVIVWADLTNYSKEVEFTIWDVTNAQKLNASSTVFKGGQGKTRYEFYFETLSNTASITFGCHMLDTPVNTEYFLIDDIEFTTDTFSKDSVTKIENVVYDGYTGLSGSFVKLKTEQQNNTGDILSVDNTSYTKFTAIATCNAVASVSGEGVSAINNEVRLYNSAGALLLRSRGYSGAASQSVTASLNCKMNIGDYLVFDTAATALTDSQTTSFSVTAWKESPHVITPLQSNLTDLAAYTPSNTQGFGTLASSDIKWKRVGGDLEMFGSFTSGTHSSVEFQLGLPTYNGQQLTIDSSYVADTPCGHLTFNQARGSGHHYIGATAGDSFVNFYYFNDASAYAIINTTGPMPTSGSTFYFYAKVPIAGWDNSAGLLAALPAAQENNFTAYLGQTTNDYSAVTGGSWISGLTLSGASSQTKTVSVPAGFFSEVPNATASVSAVASGSDLTARYDKANSTTTSLVFHVTNNGAATNQDITVMVTRAGADYTPPPVYVGNVARERVAYVSEIQAQNTGSTTALSSGSYVTCTLNTLEGDTDFISIGSNQITLQPGLYIINGVVPMSWNTNTTSVGYYRAKLYNVTGSANAILGNGNQLRTTGGAGGEIHTDRVPISGRVEISAATVFDVRAYTSDSANAISAIGSVANISGETELHTKLEIRKLR